MKVLTGTLATAMLVSGTIPAYAATETSGATSTLSVETGEAKEGSNQVSVYAEIGSQYTVTIPKTITLDRSTKTGTYTVSVTGDIAGDEAVKIVPDASLTMSQTDKADVTASITQDKTTWEVSEFGTAGNGSISANELTAGAWNGTFNFNVGLEKAEVYGEDVTLTEDNLSTYGIANTGDVTIPSVVTDSDGVKHKVTSIGNKAFYECKGLTSVTIPDSVTSIGNNAFQYCRGLKTITIPENVTSIGKFAFQGCNALTSITIPENVTSIGSNAFSGCWALTSITIPENVTSIGDNAFCGCSKLKSITIPDSVTSIEKEAFMYCSGLTSINIPNGVTSIEQHTFDGCSGLTSINIPDSVTSIGESAFSDCSGLTSITISENVTSIGKEAFKGCSGLTSVTIPESVTSIGDEAFSYCRKLSTVTYKGQNYTSYTKLENVLHANGVKVNFIFRSTLLTWD